MNEPSLDARQPREVDDVRVRSVAVGTSRTVSPGSHWTADVVAAARPRDDNVDGWEQNEVDNDETRD